MKRFIIILLSLLSYTLTVYSQHNSIDSLEQALKSATNDSLKIILQIELAESYRDIDFTKSYDYVKKAKELSETINQPWAKALTNHHISIYYTLVGDYSTALEYDNIYLQHCIAINDTALIAQAYSAVGYDYYDLGEFDEAYNYLTQSYNLAKKTNDSATMALALHNVGCVFKEIGQYDRAISHLKLSQRISEKLNDETAISYYLNEMGDIQMRMGRYDSAAILLLKSLTVSRRLHLLDVHPTTLSKLAKTYQLQGNYEKAFAYYDSTYIVYNRTNNLYGLAEVNLGRGVAFLSQGNYNQAQTLIERSLATAKTFNARILEIECYQNLYALAENQGKYQEALNHFKKFRVLKDTLFSREMLQKLHRDQIRFETESRDDQIEMFKEMEGRQKEALRREEFINNILVVVFALSVILLVTVYRSGQRRKEINKLLIKHQEETEQRSEELERLNQVKDKFFSIISHDLRSPINALSGILDILAKGGISAEEFAEQTKELRVRFNHTRTLLNNLLDWTLLQMDKLSLQAAKINLHSLVDENILILNSLQSKSINLVNKVPPMALGYADSNTINLVIRNLLTNAIKFTNDGGVVTISAEEKEEEWLLSVHDNGVGIEPEVQQILFDKTSPYTTRGTANEKGTGLGLILCKEFVEKNGGRIWVESELGRGSIFRFTIPKTY